MRPATDSVVSQNVPGGAADTEEYAASAERFRCGTPDMRMRGTGTVGEQIIAIIAQ